jgi:hypothetical protein
MKIRNFNIKKKEKFAGTSGTSSAMNKRHQVVDKDHIFYI